MKGISIDPPYNTGSAFEHYDDGVEHALWLSLRLPLLKRLENGRERTVRERPALLAERFHWTEEEREERLPKVNPRSSLAAVRCPFRSPPALPTIRDDQHFSSPNRMKSVTTTINICIIN